MKRIALFLLFLCSCHSGSMIKPDAASDSSILSGDATGLVQACGAQAIPGFTYCRVKEGQEASGELSFIGPPAKCARPDSCVFFKVWDNQARLVWGGSLKKGETRTKVSWATLFSGATFQVGSRGFWTWNVVVYWLDPDGRERVSTAQGDIVLRVYKKDYVPLHSVGSDPNFMWEWKEGSYLFKMTSALRTYVERVK